MSLLKYLIAYPKFKRMSFEHFWSKEANKLIKQLEKSKK